MVLDPFSTCKIWCKELKLQTQTEPNKILIYLIGADEENKCCGKQTCDTSYQVFNEAIVNRNVLKIAMKTQYDRYVEEFEFTTNEYRKAAYSKQYTMWKYGGLGQGNRTVILSCAVRMISQRYPNKPGEAYKGFSPH